MVATQIKINLKKRIDDDDDDEDEDEDEFKKLHKIE